MTEERERQLLSQVHTLRSAEEITGFRQQMREQGEEPTSALFAALIKQADRVRRCSAAFCPHLHARPRLPETVNRRDGFLFPRISTR